MKLVIKFSLWCLLFLTFWFSGIYFLNRSAERNEVGEILFSLSSLNEDSKSIFFVGSSRIQRSVNTTILQDSLPEYKVFNLGLSGNTLAQNIFLAHYLSKKPGIKIVFIELTPFKNGFPNSFKEAGKYLNIPNFPDSYFEYIGDNQGGFNLHLLLEYLESGFWIKIVDLQTNLKKFLFSKFSINNTEYKKIGFSPTNISNYKENDSFLVINDILRFSIEKVDIKTHNRVMQIIDQQKYKSFKVIFILPMTSNTKEEVKLEIPVFNKIPLNSKWDYDPHLLKMIGNPEYLLDKNHMNVLGAKIYTENLLNYIKTNEKEW